MKKRRRRSAIVPATILSAAIWSGAAVVPTLAGCGGGPPRAYVALIGFDMSAQTPDLVAFAGFDLSSNDDLGSKD